MQHFVSTSKKVLYNGVTLLLPFPFRSYHTKNSFTSFLLMKCVCARARVYYICFPCSSSFLFSLRKCFPFVSTAQPDMRVFFFVVCMHTHAHTHTYTSRVGGSFSTHARAHVSVCNALTTRFRCMPEREVKERLARTGSLPFARRWRE